MKRAIFTTISAAVLSVAPLSAAKAGDAQSGVSYQDRKQGEFPFDTRDKRGPPDSQQKVPQQVEPAAGYRPDSREDGNAPESRTKNLAEEMKLPRKN